MNAIIFDTETTGIDDPKIVEAAWLSIFDPVSMSITDEFEQRYNPGKPISYGAMATHHIMPEDVADCPPASEFKLPDGIDYLIGHNIDFDWKVVGEPNVKRICTLALSRSLFPQVDSHTQSAMLYFFGGSKAKLLLKNAHSALADVKNCWLLLGHLLEEIGKTNQVADWEQLWLISEQARIPKIMTFGKHKGTPIADIPSDYKSWLLRQPDVDQYLIKALRG